jgi:hypothetical protein
VRLLDIATMPGFNPDALTTAEAHEQALSVTRGRVLFGRIPGQGGLETVSCVDHGAMLCVAKNDSGRIWRCPACNEGAFAPV